MTSIRFCVGLALAATSAVAAATEFEEAPPM